MSVLGDHGPVHVVPAHQDDLPAIMGLERGGFVDGEQWGERSWQGELLGEGRTILLASAHVPVGVVCFKTTGELADLHRLLVAPSHRRQGVGSGLVWVGLQTVRQHGARAAILEVDYDNEPAIALYQRLGFEQLTARRDYYGTGRDALILKLYDLDGWPENVPGRVLEL